MGLLAAIGALLPFALWFAHDRLGRRARNVVAVLAALMLAGAAVGALSRTSLVAFLVGAGQYFRSGDSADGRHVLDVVLAVVGLGAGLVLALALRPRQEASTLAAGTPETAVEDEPPVEEQPPITGDTEVIGEDPKAAYWSSHVVDAPARPLPALPFDRATATFAVVMLGLALPLAGYDTGAFFGRALHLSAESAIALLLNGLTLGLALLLPALALRGRSLPLVASGYLLVAAGAGLRTAFGDTVSNELWFMFGTGLAAGLLLPALLRLLTPALAEDAGAVALGVLLAVLLGVTQTWLQIEGSRNSIEDGIGDVDVDLDVDNDGGVVIQPSFPLPSFPVPTFTLPTEFTFPSDFPSDFPTFTFPPGFPTAPPAP